MTDLIVNGYHGQLGYERAGEGGWKDWGQPYWTFSIGGRNQTTAHQAILKWLWMNGVPESHFRITPHVHEYGPNYVWVDFLDKKTAMHFRLISGAPYWDPDNVRTYPQGLL